MGSRKFLAKCPQSGQKCDGISDTAHALDEDFFNVAIVDWPAWPGESIGQAKAESKQWKHHPVDEMLLHKAPERQKPVARRLPGTCGVG